MAFSLDKLKSLRQVSRKEALFSIALVPGTTRAFLGASDFCVYEADLGSDKPAFKEVGKHQSYVTSVALAGGNVISGSYDGRLIWWDAAKHTQVRAVDAHTRWIRGVIVSPDGKTVASVADDMVCRLWDAASGKQLRELRGHQDKTPNHFKSMLYALAFTPDGKHLATGDKVGHIVLWESATGEQVTTLEAPVMYTWDPVQRVHSIGGIRSLSFSPDGRLLAVGGMGKVGNIDHLEGKARVEVFDWRGGKRTHEYPDIKYKGLVEKLIFHPKGDCLLAAGGAHDGFLSFLDLKAKKPIHDEKVPTHVHDVAANDHFDTFYVAGHGRVTVFGVK
jgi:WD40 repeat protein